jgi:hypothetical protein
VTIEAQEVACAHLIRSCERALLDLRSITGHAVTPGQARINLRAIELLEDVLGGWRETRDALRATVSTGQS